MIAFFGMGLLGSNFVRAMRRKGLDVAVWNRSAARAEALAETGARVALQPADAVRGAARLHLTLKDDASVDEVLAAARPGMAKGLIIVDHTTTSVEGARRRTEFWGAAGMHYLHAPVFMGPANALESSGTMLASGDEHVFSGIKSDLQAMTGSLQWYGNDPGRAAAIKLTGNSFILTLTAALGDVISVASSVGVSQDDVVKLFEDLNAPAWPIARLKRIYKADPAKPSWELQMARKDAGLMLDAAQNRPLVVLPGLAQRMDTLIAEGMGAQDYTVTTKGSHD